MRATLDSHYQTDLFVNIYSLFNPFESSFYDKEKRIAAGNMY